MSNIREESKTYICVDVETAGPIPSRYALLSIGACTLGTPRRTFYVELKPDTELTDGSAMAIHKLGMQKLHKEGSPPDQALAQFRNWIEEVIPSGRKPIFLAFNAPFDWMFIHDYFIRYLGENPFGHSAIDIKAVYMGFSGKPWVETSGKYLHNIFNKSKALSHNALEDAIDQAVMFEGLLTMMEESGASGKAG